MPRDSVFDSKIFLLTKPCLARGIVDGKTRILNISPQTVMNRNLWTAKPMGFSTDENRQCADRKGIRLVFPERFVSDCEVARCVGSEQ